MHGRQQRLKMRLARAEDGEREGRIELLQRQALANMLQNAPPIERLACRLRSVYRR